MILEQRMSGRIQLLSAALADQIAAGEVVERPASVLKELLENALDAGATRVEVEIERGGLQLISVADDGEGMTPADAHLALRRHATSKLRHADDLFALASFGFRGEALPSIASVSHLTLRTRQKQSTAGYELLVRAGETLSSGEVGAPPGTRVEVRELFANVPARLKFQKTQATEASQAVDALVRAALSAPSVYLRMRVDGRVVVELPPHANFAERAIAILRRSLGRSARIESDALREGNVAVEVHLAPPEDAVQTARRVQLLVNRRVVRDRGILSAIQVGLGERGVQGKYPQAIVAVEVPSGDVDVNVHPQKVEVRLLRAAEVHATVRHAVARAVARHPAASSATQRRRVDVPVELHEEEVAYGEERGRAFELVRAMAGADPIAWPREPSPATGEVRFLGTLSGGYLVFADHCGLIVLDQHVASSLVAAVTPCAGERLPTPILVPEEERDALAAHASVLSDLGFTIDGPYVTTAPPSPEPPLDTVVELLAAAREGGAAELRQRAYTLSALTPVATLDPAAAMSLYETVALLSHDGVLPPLDEAQFRGRRLLIRVGRAELARRLDT